MAEKMKKPSKSTKMWSAVDDSGCILVTDRSKGLLDIAMNTQICPTERPPDFDSDGLCQLPECPYVKYGEQCRRFKGILKIEGQDK